MPKSFLLLVLAAGCGLVAMLGLRQMMPDSSDQAPESIKVLVAKTDIKPYVPLSEEMVEFQERPADQVPIGAVQTLEQYDRRALRQSANKGDIIVTSKLGEKGDYMPSSEIPAGYRVYTVPINATTSHSGQIQPHDYVDIYVTYSAKDAPTAKGTVLKTKLILDYIEVFAMGADRYSNAANADDAVLAKNASLLVTPEQAAILMMAQRKGEISLALRPKDDADETDLDMLDEMTFDQLGTNVSLREKLEQEHQAEIEKLRTELTSEHQAELEGLEQKTAEQITQTLADIENKYADEQKRRDRLHAETLAGLESKNVELQTLLQAAIDESSDKESLAKRLQELQSKNGELQKLLADAEKRAAEQKEVAPVVTPELPKFWKIKVVSGRQQQETEIPLDQAENSKNQSEGKKPERPEPGEEETSIKYSPKNENPATQPTNLSTAGS